MPLEPFDLLLCVPTPEYEVIGSSRHSSRASFFPVLDEELVDVIPSGSLESSIETEDGTMYPWCRRGVGRNGGWRSLRGVKTL